MQDLVLEGGQGLLSMELCGGMLGVPGITQAEPVQTLESVLKSYIKDESGDRGQGGRWGRRTGRDRNRQIPATRKWCELVLRERRREGRAV